MLLRSASSLLLVVDMQERLAAAVEDRELRLTRARILIEAAASLRVPILVTEQYPEGLGPTDARLRPLPDEAVVLPKITFSAIGDEAIRAHLARADRRQIVVAGMEAHVCVLATALELRGAGFDVYVAADATGSRVEERRRLGLERMRDAGCGIVDSEMVVFEWLERGGTPEFRDLVRLIK